ncbi:MAG TPA: serine/threonine-protein kinase [Ktedonobacterales bacterium]|jgi:tRNA A-37 threonylcarbamoyl transferase component Bud32
MAKCRYCGTVNPDGSSYCTKCGGAFAAAAAAAAARPSAGPAAPPPPTKAPTPHAATGNLPPQSRLNGRYLVTGTVGQGGMAAVYKAVDARTRKQVAIKEMSQDGLSPTEEAEALAAFRAEADILQRLRHPNLPRVIERFSDGARHYLVMEFVEGQTLEQRQQAAGGGALPEQEVMAWAGQLCSVLAYLHGQRPPIIFRDLKPANVMVTPQGQIKLIDFGIARVFSPGRVKDTQVLGTPGFAPPEQYGKAQTDARADIYALGVTLYQLLTGYDPATTPFTLPPAHSRNARISPHVQAALEHATQLSRDARYATTTDFERDLLRPEGFVFRTGQRARTVPELVALCRAHPQEAQDHLYTRRFEGWLVSIGQRDTAALAGRIAAAGGDRGAGLATFMAQATRPQRTTAGPAGAQATAQRTAAPRAGQARATASPRATAGAAAGKGAAPRAAGAQARAGARAGQAGQAANAAAAAMAAKLAGKVAGQFAGRMASHTAQRLFAQAAAAAAAAVGTQILIEVRPHSVNFGALIAGQRGTMSITIGGQNGLPVVGKIASQAPWLKVDRAEFLGPSTIIQLSVETAALATPGPHQTNLRITAGNQQVYVPVAVEVMRTSAPNASPPPARPKRGRKASAAKYATAAAAEPEWVRVLKSWLAAVGLGAWGATGLTSALSAHLLTLPAWLPALWAMQAIMILVGAPAAVIAWWGPRLAQRTLTAWLAATGGLVAALMLAQYWLLRPGGPLAVPPLGQPALWMVLLGALGASLGATLGAAPRWSQRILRALRVVTRRTSALLLLGAVVLGGWAGFLVTAPMAYGLFAPCGAVIGIVIAVMLASSASRLLNRAAAASHP